MLIKNNKISIQQLGILFFLDLYSTSALVVPRVLTEYAKQDAWIALLGGALLAIFYTVIICKLGNLFPKDSFLEYTGKIISKPIAYVVTIGFLIKIMVTMALELRTFGELIKQLLLPETPIEIILFSMLLTASYLIRKGYEARARMGEILVYFVMIPIVIIVLFALPEVKLSNITPNFITKPMDLMKSSYFASFLFTGVEFGLLVFPFVNKTNKVLPTFVGSIVLVLLLNALVLFTTMGNLGVEETTNNIWPVMILMQTINLPGSLIERQDALMVLFWIFSIFAIINALLFFASLLLKQLMKAKEQSFLVLPILPIVYFIALIPNNIVETYDWVEAMRTYIDITFLLPIPFLLYILARLRKLGDTDEKKS